MGFEWKKRPTDQLVRKESVKKGMDKKPQGEAGNVCDSTRGGPWH